MCVHYSDVSSAPPDVAQRNTTSELFSLVYDELRRLAVSKLGRENPGQTLQPTALVHEAYLRLVHSRDEVDTWDNRGHFFGAAAEAMRRILIENARRKHRLKRGDSTVRRRATNACLDGSCEHCKSL